MRESVSDVDAVVLVIEPIASVGRQEAELLSQIKNSGVPAVLAVNKIDTVEKPELLSVIAAYASEHDFAAVVRQAGRGYLFLGRSGTGKSTHARLWLRHIAGSELLNDDNPVLVLADGTATVYGSPWSGKTPCYRNESAPAGAIIRLEQAPQNLIRSERPVAAFASLLSSCSTMIWDKATYDAICETVSGMARVVPSYRLQCLPDAEAAQLCHQTVACPS